MRPRTFAREIAFQVLYREDLNPLAAGQTGAGGDALLEQGRQTRELMEFVRHLAALRDQEDAAVADEGELYSQWLRTPALVEFSRRLIEGVTAHRAELDEKIAAAAENWSVPRMAATDRNLLRLGCYEIHHTDTPVKVVIDEAVELAKCFGGAQSAQFVNGILDKLMKRKEPVEFAMGIFEKLKQGLKKTAQFLNTDIRDLFKQEGQLVDDKFVDELFETLVKTDMGVEAAQEIADEVRTNFRARVVHMGDILEQIKVKLKSMLAQPAAPIAFAASGPTVIMVCGVNGAGKTTSIAKLTCMFEGEGKKVVLGAGDTFRAAAVEQLTIWAKRLGAEIVTGASGSDPASVAHRAVAKAREINADVCILDTAGRLQTQQSLMQELSKIHRVLGKQIPDAPHEVILVLDATTGQNGLSQAKHFTEAVRCTGLVLAKLDGTAKGGVVVAIRKTVGLPVKYIGVGEKAEDLALFEPDKFVDALFEDMR